MSRIGKLSKTSTTGAGRPQTQSQPRLKQPSTTKTEGDDATKTGVKKPEKKGIEFQLPPLSVVGKKREINFEEIRKKITRRTTPEGEDKKELARILKHLRESRAKIKVHEFANLVAKFTTDNGEAMRKVLEDDIALFRKTVTKVYENMTQDVSDVLVNEQIQTSNYYQEKYDMYNQKMLWMISEIFQMIPSFDFEAYAKEKEEYLDSVDPMPIQVRRETGEMEIQRRQEAFHRLQWLKIEGGRLSEENKRLEGKLKSLIEDHEKNRTIADLKTQIMEERKHDLEQEEHEKQEQLRELEGVLAKSAVRAEAYVRLEEDEKVRMTKPPTAKQPILKRALAKPKKPKRRPEWCSETAADMEAGAARHVVEAESAALDEKKRHKRKDKELTYGPNATMKSRMASQQDSEPEPEYPGLESASKMQERTIQKTTTTVHERRQPPKGGRYQAPRDTWGGFG